MAKQSSDPKADAVRAGREAQAEAVRLQEERDKATPTPTQEENDLAKVGALNIDAKQDDGSGPDPNDPVVPSATGEAPAGARSDAGSRNRQVKTD